MAASDITYRRGTPADASGIAALGARVFRKSYGWSLSAQDLENYLSISYAVTEISAALSNAANTFVLATTADGTIVGFMQLTQGTSDPCLDHLESKIELQRLYVGEECQGKGIGKRLVQEAEVVAKEVGAGNVWLGVWEKADWAQPVYLKAGYEKVGEHGFPIGDTVHTDWIMLKAI